MFHRPSTVSSNMGRIRRAHQVDDKENAATSSRISRPWDNFACEPPPKRPSPAHPRKADDDRFASLRVEHFVEADIASRAKAFLEENNAPPRGVIELASKFDAKAGAVPVQNQLDAQNASKACPDNPLKEIQQSSLASRGAPQPDKSSSVARDSMRMSMAQDEDNRISNLAEPLPIKTQLGRRSVKPLIMKANPPPLVGLPIPTRPTPPSTGQNSSVTSDHDKDEHDENDVVASIVDADVTESPFKRCSIRAPPVTAKPSPRRASHHSVRLPSRSPEPRLSARQSARHSVRMSTRLPQDLNEMPQSSFLAFEDDERLSALEKPVGAPTSITDTPQDAQETLDFSDPDTFDTFGSLPMDDPDERSLSELRTPERNIGALPGLSSTGSDKPVFPNLSYPNGQNESRKPKAREEDDDDGDVFDVPTDMIQGTKGNNALRELQRASVTAGNELAAQVRQMASKGPTHGRERISRAQGELELRSRFFRRWNTRYASIVDHAYFGAVLFLFRHDTKASRQGTIALKNSKMIVLADSTVREMDGFRKNGPSSLFELRTAQRKYVFACLDDEQRNYWLDNLTSYAT